HRAGIQKAPALAIDERLIAAEVARIGRIESLVGSRGDGPVQLRDQEGVAAIDGENGGPTVTSKAMLIVSSDEVPLSGDFTSVPLAWRNLWFNGPPSGSREPGRTAPVRGPRRRICGCPWRHVPGARPPQAEMPLRTPSKRSSQSGLSPRAHKPSQARN